jgi:hypothetical protein
MVGEKDSGWSKRLRAMTWKWVLGPGIEPGTRGFSIAIPKNRYAKLGGKNERRTRGVPGVG